MTSLHGRAGHVVARLLMVARHLMSGFAVFLGGVHIFLILYVATHAYALADSHPTIAAIDRISDLYSSITFANRNFGFFAPQVSADWNLSLELTTQDGRTRAYKFPERNGEMRVKMYTMLGHFATNETDMDLFSRCWAVKALNENRDARSAEVIVTVNDVPTMAEYRAGRRITVAPFYQTTFDLR